MTIAARSAMPPCPAVRRTNHGFSLVEVMVVVVLISILAFLAVPMMGGDAGDRRAYENATRIGQMLRNARTHALARGAATLVAMSTSETDRGKFKVSEAVSANISGGGSARWPVASCRSPTWPTDASIATTSADTNFIDAMDLNGALEVSANVRTQLYEYADPNGTARTAGFVCFTPSGRAFFATTSTGFAGATYMLNPLAVRVGRCDSGGKSMGITRSVVLPPSGMARVVSAAASKTGCP